MSPADTRKLAALTANARLTPERAMIPPAIDAATIWTNRPVDHDTEFAASRCSGVVRTRDHRVHGRVEERPAGRQAGGDHVRMPDALGPEQR